MNRRQLILIAGIGLLAVFTLALKCGDDPPTEPQLTPPSGTVYQNAEVAIRAVSTQPQEKNVKYVVNWDDGVTDTSAIDYPSGTEATLRHVWTDAGSYEVKALAFVADKPELESDWSDPVTVTISPNQSPTDVRITYAPIQTARNRDTRFEAVATDPDGDSIQFQFNYSNTLGNWTTPLVPSGTPVEDYGRFRTLGEHYVKVRARDQKGSMSGWSDSVMVRVDTTGVVIWAWITPDEDEGPAIGSPVIQVRNEDELIYVGAEDEFGRFYGIKTSDSRVGVRSSSTDEDYYTGHPAYVAQTGNIIVGNENGELYAFNLGLSKQWSWPDSSREYPSYIEWGVPAVNGNKIYCTRDDDRIYYLTDNGASGRYNAHYSVPGIKSNPAINPAGQVIVVTDNGRLLVLDGNNLNPVFDTVLTTGGTALSSPVVGTAGHIYVGDIGGNVYCLNPDNTVRWRVQVNGEANRIVLGIGAVYVATGMGRVYRLNPETGGAVWNIALTDASDIETSPILTANGLIYLHDDQDVLHCIKQEDGAYVWLVNCAQFAPMRSTGRGGRARRDFELPESNPALTSIGDIVIVGLDALYLVAGYTEGTLAPSAWPKWQGGMHNTGKAGGF
ncbi:MAG: PQQ-binding-like beta-propeller repeat protein [bacterium]